ncbi:DUF930 domain-containing protein [Breoghania sp. L-A4]|uniref:DUF930 domain-containing protein n=1 Tax=Breoghania sp. L-A4 TaxID=2304600 RepID=UPI000E35FD2E|nr:DUF930 domain-containing protein [Breoghania sp. L-A4]AXS42069.1 DUF930 domain-containing protein [Breoghania sp. L-A4]
MLKPVVEFGETDSGSEVAPDGDAAEAGEQTEPDETEAEQPEPELAELEQAEPEQVEPEAPEAAAAPETAEAEPADPLEAPEPEASDTELPELEAAGTEFPEPDLPPSEVAMSLPVLASENGAEPLGDAASALPRLAAPLPKPAAGPSEAASAAAPSGPMTEAKELFSTAMLDGERARTAMAGMPPSERVDVLCMTELRAQLNAADPPRPPELLPSFRVQPGTVLEPRNAAFRSRGLWYELAFRCETDAGATRVVKFSHRIGAAIPRTEWRQRGFPSF